MALSEELLSPFDRVIKTQDSAWLGAGLVRPFQRDGKSDFANSSGVALVKACIGQILGTQAGSNFSQGELPWRTEFGSLLHTLKHKRNDAALADLTRTYVAEAIRRWEPRVRLKHVEVTRDVSELKNENVLSIRLRYDIVASNTAGNDVLVRDVAQTVTVGG
jgi:phage baseplate assembly protein W